MCLLFGVQCPSAIIFVTHVNCVEPYMTAVLAVVSFKGQQLWRLHWWLECTHDHLQAMKCLDLCLESCKFYFSWRGHVLLDMTQQVAYIGCVWLCQTCQGTSWPGKSATTKIVVTFPDCIIAVSEAMPWKSHISKTTYAELTGDDAEHCHACCFLLNS